METARHKEERISIRLDANQKSIIDQAALIAGVNRSSFMLMNAIEAATKIVEQQQQIKLSQRDWNKFVELVASDTEPTPAAVKAAKRYKKVS